MIHPDSEAVFYGVLDVLAKPVWGAVLIWGHRNISPVTLGLRIRDVGEVTPFGGEKGGFQASAGNGAGAREVEESAPRV